MQAPTWHRLEEVVGRIQVLEKMKTKFMQKLSHLNEKLGQNLQGYPFPFNS